jgi:hypothetical protein
MSASTIRTESVKSTTMNTNPGCRRIIAATAMIRRRDRWRGLASTGGRSNGSLPTMPP